MRRLVWLAALALVVPWLASAAPSQPMALGAAAPNNPGTTGEAQASMDALAMVLTQKAQWPEGSIHAAFYPSEGEGLARLSKPDAAVALVPVPFFLLHRRDLGLRPRVAVETVAGGISEQWSLVAKRGRVKSPIDLNAMTVSSTAGYAPEFVRGALGTWGRIPDSARVEASKQVLSELRKAATGADIALLLDGEQTAAMQSLPFAHDLEVVAHSARMPTALVATVGSHLTESRWSELERALLALSSSREGIAALGGIRMVRFAPHDKTSLASALAVWPESAR